MQFAKRIFLFLAVNFLVMLTISITLNVLGVHGYMNQYGIDYSSLMIFCLVWGMGGAFISLLMSKFLAKMMMGVKVIPDSTNDPDLRWLVHTVARQAQQAGLRKSPEVGVYDSPELNAFATGPTRNNSIVAVSSGLLQRMDKTQIEGVLAHELTHIANGDMVTLTLISGVVNAFVMFLARIAAFALSQSVEEKNRYWVRFLSTFIFEIFLSILGSIVVAYFSRWREFRADAGGAKIAGREKMVSALRGLQKAFEINTGPEQESPYNAFKISSRKGGFISLFATHPPLELRISRLQQGQY